jgi:hypothetical protein
LVSVAPWIVLAVQQVTADKPVSATKPENKTRANNKFLRYNLIKAIPPVAGWLLCLLDLQ